VFLSLMVTQGRSAAVGLEYTAVVSLIMRTPASKPGRWRALAIIRTARTVVQSGKAVQQTLAQPNLISEMYFSCQCDSGPGSMTASTSTTHLGQNKRKECKQSQTSSDFNLCCYLQVAHFAQAMAKPEQLLSKRPI
jgi:hypothetical protein